MPTRLRARNCIELVNHAGTCFLAEAPPSTPMKNEQNANVPTDSKLCLKASGPGVTTSGEHAITTTESVPMDSREGTISNEPTKCEAVSIMEPTRTEGATETADPTKNEDVSAQIVIMNREKGVTANQDLTKGESNVTGKNISPKKKEDATAENEPLKSSLGKQNYYQSSSCCRRGINTYVIIHVMSSIWKE